MDYQKIYTSLIEKAKHQIVCDYSEEHHIVPRSLNGSDDKSNLVMLSGRQHYIAHLLLYYIYKNDEIKGRKMLNALVCMRYGRTKGKRKIRFNSRLYEKLKREFSFKQSEKMKTDLNNMKGKVWLIDVYNRKNIVWDKNNPDIPDGCVYGRCDDFDKLFEIMNIKNISKEEFISYRKKYRNRRFRLGLEDKKSKSRISLSTQIDIQAKIDETKKKAEERNNRLQQMYDDYLQFGFEFVKEKYNYSKSRENLSILFKRHVKNYDPTALLQITLKLKRDKDGYSQANENKKMSLEEKREYFSKIYSFFKVHSFDETKKEFGWVSSRNALIMNFKKYVPEYVPTKTGRWK